MQILPIRLGRKLDIEPETILVYVGEGLVGDAFMRLPFAAALREVFPRATLTWAFRDKASGAGRRIAPLLAQFCDEILFDLALGDGRRELLSPRPLAPRRWDLVIDTQRVVPRAALVGRIRHRRFASFAGRYCLSDVKPLYRLGESVKVRHYGRQLMSLLAVIETGRLAPARPFEPAPVKIPAEVSAWAATLPGLDNRPVMIAPGAGGRAKCWPLEKVAALGRNLLSSGHALAILLGPAEQEWHATLSEAIPGATFPLAAMPAMVADREPYATLALAARAGVTVAMDSGQGHMLAAASLSHVTLYGPTKPATFAPAAHTLRILRAQDFGGDAMADIPEVAVRAAVLDALGSGPTTSAAESSQDFAALPTDRGEPVEAPLPSSLAGEGGLRRKAQDG